MKSMNSIRQQLGVSMVELMVAMVLGLIITAGVIQIFTGNSQAYRFHEALSRIQENGRYALDELTRDIRMAGYLGCSSQAANIANLLASTPADFDPLLGIQGWEADGTSPGDVLAPNYSAAAVPTGGGSWSTNGGATLPALDAVAAGDIIRVWRGDESVPTITSITPSPGTSTVVRITQNHDFQPLDLLMLSDCRSADWVQACSVAPNGSETDLTISSGCSPGNIVPHEIATAIGGEVSRIMGNIYYISRESANTPPALYRSRLTTAAAAGVGEPLVEGVESLQILYGVDLTGNRRIDEYRTADDVPNWRSVVAVRVSLLLVSTEDNLVEAPQSVFFNAAQQTPADRRLRQVMTTTIALRNRMP